MESKKINQLATELAPELSDLTIIGDPTTGISKKITLSQMASLFTGTVEEYASLSAFPLVGTADTIYIALDTNILYRWDTTLTSYVELSPNIVTSLVFNDANGFDGTISLVGSTATLTITTALTTGSVGFIGASGALTQDNSNFFWDNSNKRLGINTNAPTTALDVFGSGIIGRINGTSTNNAFLGFASAGTNKWSIGNVQSDHRFRIYSEANTSELVSVLQTGEFGIGIANPTTKLHIDGGASALIANLDANVSVAKSISFRSDNSARINFEVSGTESGSNAGANFYLRAYSDAGSLLNTPLTIERSTGAATFIAQITAPYGSFSQNGSATTITQNARFQNSTTSTANGSGVGIDFALYSAAGLGKQTGQIASVWSDNTSNEIADLAFYTRPTGAGISEKLRITGNGNILINTTTDSTSGFNKVLVISNDYLPALELRKTGSIGGAKTYNIGVGNNGEFSIYDSTSAADRILINASGNVGINATPKTWNSAYSVFQVGSTGALFNTSSNTILSHNLYVNSSDNNTYITTSYATQYRQVNGTHIWYTAPSGSANTTITLTERFKINNNGDLILGNTSSIYSYFGEDSGGLWIEQSGNTTSTSKIRLQSSKSNDATNYSQLIIDPYNGIKLKKIGTGNCDLLINTDDVDAGIGGNVSSNQFSFPVSTEGMRISTTGTWYWNFNSIGGAGIQRIVFRYAGTSVGSIGIFNTGVQYNTTWSDINKKKNFEEWNENVLDSFKAINPKLFNFINEEDDAPKTKGFIAQEMIDKFPEAYTKAGDEFYSFNPSGMVVYLMKAIQQLEAKVSELENKQ